MEARSTHRRADPLLLHRLVWNGNVDELERELTTNTRDVNVVDGHGYTPLHLAILLCSTVAPPPSGTQVAEDQRLRAVDVLLNHGADLNPSARSASRIGIGNSSYGQQWTMLQDATSTANPLLLRRVLNARAQQQHAQVQIHELVRAIQDTPDFQTTLDWHFSSWVPLMSRMLPSDKLTITKRGSSVRVDTTLVGFTGRQWVRGRRSFIVSTESSSDASASNGSAPKIRMVQLHHDTGRFVKEDLSAAVTDQPLDDSVIDAEVQRRLDTPLVSTWINRDKVSFERAQAGIWGFRSERTETVGSFDCAVFNASDIDLVTTTRLEHLPLSHPSRQPQSQGGLFGMFAGDASSSYPQSATASQPDDTRQDRKIRRVQAIGPTTTPFDRYENFSHPIAGQPQKRLGVDFCVGRPREQRVDRQRFKMTLWMTQDYPLSLTEQVLPILDLLAASSPHLRQLRDFISLDLPAGFPVQIEIPVYHVFTARVTFGACHLGSHLISDDMFEIPPGYQEALMHGGSEEDALLAMAVHQSLLESDDDYALEMALQQSLLEQQRLQQQQQKQRDGGEPSNGSGVDQPAAMTQMTEEEMIQRAISLSLLTQHDGQASSADRNAASRADGQQAGAEAHEYGMDEDAQLRLAIERSLREQ